MQSLRQWRKLRTRVESELSEGKQRGREANLADPRRLENQPEADSRSPGSVHTLVNPDTHQSDEGKREASGVSDHRTDAQRASDEQGAILVEWEDPNDPLNPRNWSLARRCWIFAILWINVFAVDWASSADSQAGSIIAKQFGVSEEAEALSPSLYTFGIAAGAVFAGPISETVGRNPIYVLSRCLHVAWLLGAALAPNFGAQCVFRLFAGLSGSILLAIHSASTADLFGPVERTWAWPVIALASFWGTSFSPVAGAWIAQTGVNWRWTEWIALILSGSTLILTLFFLPETFSPILLKWKAEHLRKATGNDKYKAELDLQSTVWHRFGVAWQRALHMITREPIVILLGMWLVVEYIVVFGFLQGFSFVFGDTYDFSRGLIGTVFVAIAVGTTLWTVGVPFYYRCYVMKTDAVKSSTTDDPNNAEERYGVPGVNIPEPEYRLWSAAIAAPALPISLFWLGWTNYSWISPWSNLGSIVLLGFSWAGIYVTVYQYILDVYGIYAGSALSMITCWRYLASGFINMVSRPMYDGIGVHWSATWLGILALLLTPAPLIFYRFGPKIRAKSAFASKYGRPAHERKRIGVAAGWQE